MKTGLLAGEPLWELPDDELVRRCAAFKAGVCLRDPLDRGERAILNLGHTFAHALETAAGYERRHARAGGRARAARGAASVRPRHRARWRRSCARSRSASTASGPGQAMQRDKKTVGGELRLVLLGDDGPRWDVAVPDVDVRRALDALIAG